MKLKKEEILLLSSIPAVSVVVASAVVSVDSVLLRMSSKVPHISREVSTDSVNDKKCRSIFFLVRFCLLNSASSDCD